MNDLKSKYLEPLAALKYSVRETIEQIFEYLDNPQSEDLNEYSRFNSQEVMTHSRFELRGKLVRWLQTGHAPYQPSATYQDIHYKRRSIGTNTVFKGGSLAEIPK